MPEHSTKIQIWVFTTRLVFIGKDTGASIAIVQILELFCALKKTHHAQLYKKSELYQQIFVFLKINQIIHNKEKKCTNLIYNRKKITSYSTAF